MIVFDDLKFDKDLATNFISMNGSGYKLQDVWFLVAHRDKPWLKYVAGKKCYCLPLLLICSSFLLRYQECNKFKFGIVSFMDHKEISEFFNGTKTKEELMAKEKGFRIAPPVIVSGQGAGEASGGSGSLAQSFQELSSGVGGAKRGREDEGADEGDGAGPPSSSQQEDENRAYSAGVFEDDQAEARQAASVPLTEAQIRVGTKKDCLF